MRAGPRVGPKVSHLGGALQKMKPWSEKEVSDAYNKSISWVSTLQMQCFTPHPSVSSLPVSCRTADVHQMILTVIPEACLFDISFPFPSCFYVLFKNIYTKVSQERRKMQMNYHVLHVSFNYYGPNILQGATRMILKNNM